MILWRITTIRRGHILTTITSLLRIDLSPEVVDCIVFWTKNPIPMLPRLSELDAYKYYFQCYGKDMETNLPDKKGQLIPAFHSVMKKKHRSL